MKKGITAVLGAALALAVPLFALQEQKKEEPKKESRTAYVRRIFEKDRASYGDACRLVLSLAAGEHTDSDFAAVHKELVSRGIAVPDWELGESSLVTKGALAYMLCKTLGIRGGLTVTVFGMTRRYALRECLYVGLIAGGTTDEYVTGREMIDVVTNAEIYKQEGNVDSLRK